MYMSALSVCIAYINSPHECLQRHWLGSEMRVTYSSRACDLLSEKPTGK